MAENMMNSEHKATNEAYRANYDNIFKKQSDCQKKGYVIRKSDLEKVRGKA